MKEGPRATARDEGRTRPRASDRDAAAVHGPPPENAPVIRRGFRVPVGPAAFLLRTGAAAVSGLLLALTFPDAGWAGLAWFAFLPLLLVPPSRRIRWNVLTGFSFGAVFFLLSLFWLTTVTWIGWLLLSLICAVFPAAWYALIAPLRTMLDDASRDVREAPGSVPPLWVRPAFPLVAAALWTAGEWVRGHVFTGFPWNLAGVSQWRSPFLLGLTPWTGVYGVSALIVLINSVPAAILIRWYRRFVRGERPGFPSESLTAAVALLFTAALAIRAPRPARIEKTLTVAAVQGCLPQQRQWTEAQLRESLRVYRELTRRALEMGRPDLIVWPETAIPAPLRYEEHYARTMASLVAAAKTWFLVGTIDYRPRTAPSGTGRTAEKTPEPDVFNSVFLIDPDGVIRGVYDKVHIVPFGEFVPFERLWPRLARWFGMGRSLTRGREFTVFLLPGDVPAGVNICYEDVFPEISRRFVLRGARVLFTLTNDAWYAESAGSAQHLAHAVFRAAETRRPLLRSGNNSDTCLILPDGRITGLLRDPATGNRFVRGVRLYRVPVYRDAPLTFYTRYGDVFALACLLISAAWVAVLIGSRFRKASRAVERITGSQPRE